MTYQTRDQSLAYSSLQTAGGQQGTELRFFTICARNFLPQARILWESTRRHHPGASFTVYLCDRDGGYEAEALGVDIVRLDLLGIPKLDQMIRRYNITELCTAIKPYCFLREIDQIPQGKGAKPTQVVYLDPDIEVFSPLVEVMEALDGGAEIVLTPHILFPAERTEFEDQHFLKLGVYNLGFIGLADTSAVRDLLYWWGRRMVAQCIIDVPNGLFVDQKWADLFPSFVDHVRVLRHPGYNIAYWNLPERRICEEDGEFLVNGEPLRFVHFSGVIKQNSEQISRHSEMFTIENSFGYGDLVTRYRRRLLSAEARRFSRIPYGFIWNGGSGTNLHTPKEGEEERAPWRSPSTYLFARQFFCEQEYADFKNKNRRMIERQRAFESSLTEDRDEPYYTWGYCYLCASHQKFATTLLYSVSSDSDGRPIPNWREHVGCPKCTMPNRMRASTHLFLQEFEPDADTPIYLTERKTVLYDWMAARFSNLTGSEYFGDRFRRGEMVDGIRNENVEALSFPDEQFRYVLSFDVLEHVAFPDRAFREIARVLEPGGHFFFTVPANLDRYDSLIRAEALPNGSILHHMPPEYHGNPVDPEGGALCFRYFGWDAMDMLRQAGFRSPHILHYWSREFGYLGPDQAIFIAEKA